MNKQIVSSATWLAGQLRRLTTFLEGLKIEAPAQSKFVNLAPTDQADKDGVYSEALAFATTDPKVLNIALTGPYGSGKSSIIQSFLHGYSGHPLHISLAAFVQDADKSEREGSYRNKVTRQEIERSILQQMLYGADANKLPLSRFKRIQSPGVLAIFKSLFILLGLFSLWHVISARTDVISGEFFNPFAFSNWLNLGSFVVGVAFLWITLHHFYVASFGLSLKSISLKDIEIRPASDNLESILNRHLDEIIYFFQSTKYDLVIIEDLDRFDDAEIFVTLREINSLVNENAGVNRTIKFLYALRDDVFVNTDRTKFFEFIIPVIPIINASNSIDMVLDQGKRLELDGRLDRQFLREVSRYLNDLRLIQNIFNEYAIYVANLETDGENILDANKLLAVLIYKNVYPKDFEQLHRGEGNFADVLARQDELVAHNEAEWRAEIADLERDIDVAERQTPLDLKELRQVYAMELIHKGPADAISVYLQGQHPIPLRELSEHDGFEKLIEAPQAFFRNVRNQQTQVDIRDLQKGVHRQKNYSQRKAEIEAKAEGAKSESMQRIRALREKISSIRTIKFHEIVRSSASRVTDLFDGFGERGELARYLIMEGHLDDTYYQYTSLFHSGRLSPNDNKFLIQIRSYITPDYDFQIDNPKEVIAAMRDEDFGQSFVRNTKLVDCLLKERARYKQQVQRFFAFVGSNFDESEAFLEAYYDTGSQVPNLLAGLANAWGGFLPAVIASRHGLSHVSQLVAHLPARELEVVAKSNAGLSQYVAENLPEILALVPDLQPERVEKMNLEVADLPAIDEYRSIVKSVVQKGLFKISIANFEYVYREVLSQSDIQEFRGSNFTTLRSMKDPILLERVEREFDRYFNDVLLELSENTDEDVATLIDLLSRPALSVEKLRKFLRRQTALLPTLEDVPEKLHAVVFEEKRVAPNWENCVSFMASESFSNETLIDYLDQNDVRASLVEQSLSTSEETLPLRRFLLKADALSNDNYRQYVRAFPNSFSSFPEGLAASKLQILIEERKITFSSENLDSLDDETSLPVLFVERNISDYLAKPDTFALDDEFRESLLKANLSDDEKRAIIDLMDISALTNLPERAALVGRILDRTNVSVSSLDEAVARALVLNVKQLETQVSLLNKLQTQMAVDDVRQILAELPKPYSEIRKGYHTPRLPKSDENFELVRWLKSRGIISSWSEVGGWLVEDYIRVNLKRP